MMLSNPGCHLKPRLQGSIGRRTHTCTHGGGFYLQRLHLKRCDVRFHKHTRLAVSSEARSWVNIARVRHRNGPPLGPVLLGSCGHAAVINARLTRRAPLSVPLLGEQSEASGVFLQRILGGKK